MEEDLDLLVYYVHDVRPEETVSCKVLVVLTLKAINVTRTCCHRSQEGNFCSKVIPVHPHTFLGAVSELLGFGDHVDVLIQELARFFLGESVLDHGK